MSPRAIVTGPAKDDLLSIWEYLADHATLDTADRVIAAIRDGIEQLVSTPRIGFMRESFAPPSVRFWRVHSFYIVYRWEKQPIEILRVVHAARDVQRVLGDID